MKKPYVCLVIGLVRSPLTDLWPDHIFFHITFSKRTVHHDDQWLWLIASPVALPPPIFMAPLHPNTMGDALTLWFSWNQRWRRVTGGVLPKQIQSFFYTQQSTADMADCFACGAATPRCHQAATAAELLPPPPSFPPLQNSRCCRCAAAAATAACYILEKIEWTGVVEVGRPLVRGWSG